MYYTTKKNNSFGVLIILTFLLIIIFILINLDNKLENNVSIEKQEVEATATKPAQPEINLQDLINNTSYSIVGISKLTRKEYSYFCR